MTKPSSSAIQYTHQRRKRDAKLALLRVLVDAYKWYDKQVDDWRDVSSISGVDTMDAELDIRAVQGEVSLMIDRLRAEIE